MATGLSQAVIDAALDAEITGTLYVELHTADPGANGTTSVASNSTRKSCTFAAASAGSKATASDLNWTAVPTTETYSHFAVFDAASAGNFKFSGTITGGAVTAGDTFDIATGQLSASITGAA
jgi:hypothetical protein